MPPLRSAAVALVQLAILHISRIEKFTDKAQKTLVLNSFTENANHDIVVDIVEEAFNISFHKPLAPCKAILNHSQGCVTAFIGSKAVGGVLKAAFHRWIPTAYGQLPVPACRQWTGCPEDGVFHSFWEYMSVWTAWAGKIRLSGLQ